MRLLYRLTSVELAVLVAGTTSMGLEILAGRMIAPVFGSSIYTWGAVIGVFLAALSLGYYHGGRRADDASQSRVAVLLLYGAVFVAVLVLAGDKVLQTASVFPVPARFAAVLPAVVLFGPPVYVLGFITPYAAELSRVRGTGEASGRVFAIGTVGSILGTFGTTFVLVPALSVPVIGGIFGTLLVAAAAAVSFREQAYHLVTAAGLVAAILVGVVAAGSYGLGVPGEVVYETQTPYQQLTVTRRDGVMTMLLDGQPQSAMDINDPDRHVFAYTRYFHFPVLLTDVDEAVFIGGGGFTGPKHFVFWHNASVDVAELDPAVIRTAKQYFNVSESDRLRIHNRDGRRFLQETNRTYDLIVVDAYRKDKVPFQLTTKEFLQLAATRLEPDGVLLINVISAPSGPGSRFFRAEYRTVEQVFPHVTAYRVSYPVGVQNIEIVATKTRQPSTMTLLQRNRDRDSGIDLADEIRSRIETVNTADVPVLRDDRAPVDKLLDPLTGRRYIPAQNTTQ